MIVPTRGLKRLRPFRVRPEAAPSAWDHAIAWGDLLLDALGHHYRRSACRGTAVCTRERSGSWRARCLQVPMPFALTAGR